MEQFQKDVLTLIRNAFSETKENVSADFSYENAFVLGKEHQIVPVLYYGAIHDETFASSPIAFEYFQDTCLMITRTENQKAENDKIFARLEEKKIPYMPVKGTILKPIYPYPEMRMMGDTDILVAPDKVKEANEMLVNEFHYDYYKSSGIEDCFHKDLLNVEIHKRLFSQEQKDLYACFGDGWQGATLKEGTSYRYEMSVNDCYLYLVLHLTKHYRNGGVGIKQVLDLYVYQNHYTVNFDYVKERLQTLGLLSFYENVQNLLGVWFDGKESTERTDFMTSYIFSSGSFGTRKNHENATALKIAKKTGNVKNARKVATLRVFFPTYQSMTVMYPILKKIPILLPFCYLLRFVNRLLVQGDAVKQTLHAMKQEENQATEQSIKDFHQGLLFVGLDTDFDFDD